MTELCSKGFSPCSRLIRKSDFDEESLENEIRTSFVRTEQIYFRTGRFAPGGHKLPADCAHNCVIALREVGVPEHRAC
jgi:hypothetical protein